MEIQRTTSFERLTDFIKVYNLLRTVHQMKSKENERPIPMDDEEEVRKKLKLNEPGRTLKIRTLGQIVDIKFLEDLITESMNKESYIKNTKFGELKDACHAYRRVFKTSIRNVHFCATGI